MDTLLCFWCFDIAGCFGCFPAFLDALLLLCFAIAGGCLAVAGRLVVLDALLSLAAGCFDVALLLLC